MDYRVVWSQEALSDIEDIASYISKDSPVYAQAVVSKIIHASRKLIDFPLSGRMVPEVDDEDIREKFIYSYRLIYQVSKNQAIVLAVIHGKRLLSGIAERLDENEHLA